MGKRAVSVAARALFVTGFAAMTATSAMAAPVVINDNYTGQDTDYAPNSTKDIVGTPAFDLDHFVVDVAAGTVAVYGEYIKHVFDPSVNLGTTMGDLFITLGHYGPVTPTSEDNYTNGQGWQYATSYNGPLSTSGTFSLWALFSPGIISYTLSSFSNPDPSAFRNGQEVAVNRAMSQQVMFFQGQYTVDTTNGVLTFFFPRGLPVFPDGGFRITQTCANDVLEGGLPAVPEPTSMMLVGTGLVGLAGTVRRRLMAR